MFQLITFIAEYTVCHRKKRLTYLLGGREGEFVMSIAWSIVVGTITNTPTCNKNERTQCGCGTERGSKTASTMGMNVLRNPHLSADFLRQALKLKL